MTDSAITIALIKLAEVLINSVAPIITALAALVAVWLSWRNGKKIDSGKVEVAAVKKIAKQTSVEVKQMTTGVFNSGFLQGAADERRKNSDLGTLE